MAHPAYTLPPSIAPTCRKRQRPTRDGHSLLHRHSGHLCALLTGSFSGRATIGRILLANLFQSSSSTFSCVSFPGFFAFQEGIWDTQVSALLNSPTVSGGFFAP